MTKTILQVYADHPVTAIADNDLGLVRDTSGPFTGAALKSIEKDYFLRGAASAMLMVASSTAPTAVKRRADYVCDGTADESEINAALALGSVQLTDGDYNVAAPTIMNYPGHSLAGVGVGTDMTGNPGIGRGFGTRLLLASGFTGSYAIDVQQTGVTRPAGGVTIRDLEVDGANNGTTVQGIHMRSFNASLERVVVRRMTSHGVNWHGYTTGEISPNGWSTYDSQMVNCILQNCAAGGLYLQNGTDLNITSCVFNDNLHGIWHDGGASCQFTNCHSYSNTNNAVLLDGAGSRDKFIGCKFEHSGQHGFVFNGNGVPGAIEVLISDCGFGMSGELAAVTGTYSHIKFIGTSSSDRAQIRGCYFHNADSASKLAQYCVDMGAGTVTPGLILSNNDFGTSLSAAGVTTAAINFTGTPTVIAIGNIGLNDHRAVTPAPTVVAGAGAGTSPTVAVSAGSDYRGTVTLTTGTGTPNTTADQFVVTYNQPYVLGGTTVHIEGSNQASALLNPYLSTFDNNGFTVRCAVAPAASTAYSFRYIVQV